MPKRYLTGGGKDLKNRCKTYGYFFKIFNFVKIGKIFSDAQGKLLDRRTEKNTGSSVTLVNEKLRFAEYDKIREEGSCAQEGTGASHSWKFFLTTVCRAIKKIIEELKSKPSNRSTLIPPARASCRGSILIEFAICMPVLIILLFYIHDLVRIKRYYAQTEFVGQQIVNLIQNVSQNRTNKKITLSDLKNIGPLAWFTVYPGTTMSKLSNGYYEKTYRPFFYIYYVKGLDNGNASCIYRIFHELFNALPPSGINQGTAKNDQSISAVRYRTNVPPAQIHPNLKINPGEVKIIVDTVFYTAGYRNVNGISEYGKTCFGFRLANPRLGGNNQGYAFFNSVVIFTPKPGLFDETAPS